MTEPALKARKLLEDPKICLKNLKVNLWNRIQPGRTCPASRKSWCSEVDRTFSSPLFSDHLQLTHHHNIITVINGKPRKIADMTFKKWLYSVSFSLPPLFPALPRLIALAKHLSRGTELGHPSSHKAFDFLLVYRSISWFDLSQVILKVFAVFGWFPKPRNLVSKS